MIKLRDHLTEKGAAVTGTSPWVPEMAFANKGPNKYGNMEKEEAISAMDSISMIGDVITEEELAGCTTCRACEDACPVMRSEEHTSELQSRGHLVCRLLLVKKKKEKHLVII